MRVEGAVAWLLLAGGAIAQEPAAKPLPAPALVLLLRAPLALDADAIRTRWERIVGGTVAAAVQPDGTWLVTDGDGLLGGRDGVRFRVRVAAFQQLDDQALRHLDDEERAALRAHRTRLEIACTSELAADAPRATAYRMLGGVAAAVAARGVIGIGAADHGTLSPAPKAAELRQHLLGEDVLAWLVPTQSSSLVVFARKAITFDAKDLETRIGKELGITFSGKSDAQDFVVVEGEITIVKVGGVLVMMHSRPAMPDMKADAARYDDLRLRRAIGEHQAMLHLTTSGVASDAAEAERRRLLARIVAALWSDDFLLFSWHCNLALVPAGEDVQQRLRADDPVAAMLDDAPVPVVEATDPNAMQQAIEQARREWATAAEHHRKGGELSVKLPFPTRAKSVEHIWVLVTRIDGDVVHGTLGNEPVDVEGKKLGDPVTGKVAELSDWLFVRDGAMVGGYTVKVLQAQQAKKPK